MYRTLLKAPITPFTVTFCHIIAHPLGSAGDLRLLTEFVATLKELRRFSDGMAKLHKLSDVFCKVAELYVRSKAQESAQQVNLGPNSTAVQAPPSWVGQPAVHDIDNYLSTMGFMVPPATSLDGFSSNDFGDVQYDANYLTGWYAGNSSLMGLLEQDMSLPIPAIDNDWTASGT